MKNILLILFLLAALVSCKPKQEKDNTDKTNPLTPVKVVHPETGQISDYLELNATSSFLRKESVKSSANGYVSEIRISIGDKVHRGEVLFMVQTKESKVLGNFKNTADSSFRFSGMIPVLCNKDGVVSAITHQKGDYVQDADPLATIAEESSLVFLIDAPYEYHKYLNLNKSCSIDLPDGTVVPGFIQRELPVMDVNSQTQNYVVKPVAKNPIPEGLIARIRILKTEKGRAQVLPKGAILSNEKEDNFWVMKMVNDSIAVKVSVQPGLQDNDKQEIISPVFAPEDRIIVSGNYGLSDTAKVKIIP